MKEIKFRQPIWLNCKFHGWHYWGFINGEFIGPCYDPDTSLDESQQFTGFHDAGENEIFEGDLWERDGIIYEVKWRHAAWELRHRKGPIEYPYFYSNAEYGKIIGNIFKAKHRSF